MGVVGLNDAQQLEVLQLVSAVLHLGNIAFVEDKNFAAIQSEDCESVLLFFVRRI